MSQACVCAGAGGRSWAERWANGDDDLCVSCNYAHFTAGATEVGGVSCAPYTGWVLKLGFCQADQGM